MAALLLRSFALRIVGAVISTHAIGHPVGVETPTVQARIQDAILVTIIEWSVRCCTNVNLAQSPGCSGCREVARALKWSEASSQKR